MRFMRGIHAYIPLINQTLTKIYSHVALPCDVSCLSEGGVAKLGTHIEIVFCILKFSILLENAREKHVYYNIQRSCNFILSSNSLNDSSRSKAPSS